MTNRWTLRAATVVLGLFCLALGAGLAGFMRISHARRASLAEWNAQRCTVYRSTHQGAADPCAPPPRGESIVATLHGVRTDVSQARHALDAGDERSASRSLAHALDRVSAVERRSSFFATAVAARATSEILDVIDAHPSLATRPELRDALARTTLATARRALEADRLRAANDALVATPRTAFVTWGATDARIADGVEHEDSVMLSMQSAARAGNRAACERAGATAQIGPHVCPALMRTMETARRFDRVRARAR